MSVETVVLIVVVLLALAAVGVAVAVWMGTRKPVSEPAPTFQRDEVLDEKVSELAAALAAVQRTLAEHKAT
ncbi:MAG: hypothetical protein ACE5F5_13755, partial [Acidimicrobiia bacterium]